MQEEESRLVTRDNFSVEILSNFYQMYQAGLYTDLALVSQDGVQYAVHKIVVCASTDAFVDSQKCVSLDVNSSELKCLVEFMYIGGLVLNIHSVDLIRDAAETLNIRHAVQLCDQFKRERSQLPNVLSFDDLSTLCLNKPEAGYEGPPREIKSEPLLLSEATGDFEGAIEPPVKRKRGRPRKNIKVTPLLKQGRERTSPKPKTQATVDRPSTRGFSRSPLRKQNYAGKEIMKTHSQSPKKKRTQIQPPNKVSCRTCNRKFSFSSMLRYHSKTSLKCHKSSELRSARNKMSFVRYMPRIVMAEDGSAQYRCSNSGCDKTFPFYQMAKIHHKVKHAIKSRCVICAKVCGNKLLVRMHVFRKHGTTQRPTFKCKRCPGRPFLYESNLKKHMANIHGKKSALRKSSSKRGRPTYNPVKGHAKTPGRSYHHKWLCVEDDCKFSFSTEFNLNKHVGSSHPDVDYKCPLCTYSSKLNDNLLTHMKDGHKRKSSELPTCDICGRTFCRQAQLLRHKFSRHKIADPSIKLYKCEVEKCKYVAVHKLGLEKHQVRHSDEKPFKCDLCDRTFKSEKTIEKHKNKSHFNIRPYICDQCGQAYGEASELRTHIARHSNTKSFQCDMCEYSTHEKGNFKTHLFNRHRIKLEQDMTVFECDVCAYTTDNKARFRDHMKGHDNVRDLPCPHCGKLFTTKKCLRGHVVKVHNPKTLACDFCGYATADKSKLNAHVRVMHTERGFKPYKCFYCDFHCATSGNCRKHVANKHKGKEIKYTKLDLKPRHVTTEGEAVPIDVVPIAQLESEKSTNVETSIADMLSYEMGTQQGMASTTVTLSNDHMQTPALPDNTQTVMLPNLQTNVPIVNLPLVPGTQNYEILNSYFGQNISIQ